MKLLWWTDKNFGDVISPFIVEYFWKTKVERADKDDTGKLLAIGSIIPHIKTNDIVWGSGLARDILVKQPTGLNILALRGPLTAKGIKSDCTCFGDPALLLPKMYNPKVKVVNKLGTIPHYIEKGKIDGEFLIDIEDNWKEVVHDIKSCEIIASSSLHGIVVAEAYGIPAIWIEPSNKIIGGKHKFQDYFLGTGRKPQETGKILDPILNLEEIQERLIEAI